jgi:hypothetical protein
MERRIMRAFHVEKWEHWKWRGKCQGGARHFYLCTYDDGAFWFEVEDSTTVTRQFARGMKEASRGQESSVIVGSLR